MAGRSNSPQDREQRLALTSFIEAARAKGGSDAFIYQLLRSRGWSQQDVESAFVQVYESLTGLPVPMQSGRASGSAREAFLYLLLFLTLGIWSQALGHIGFIFVDELFPDPLNKTYGNEYYGLASSLARLIVVFPIYLLLMRLLSKDLATHPDKYQSGVRKWLTYLVLLVAALTAIIDLVVFLTSLLRGELTPRFIYKVIIVLIIAGGIFWYYLTWLQGRAVRS
jgi:hypothetical protein